MTIRKYEQCKLFIISALFALSPLQLMAQEDDSLLSETESVLNSDQIDIDGTYRRRSAADKIEKMRKRLEKQNEEMVEKKIEDIRIKNETKLTNQLRDAFSGKKAPMPAPAVTVVKAPKVVVKAPKPKKVEEKLGKVTPSIGYQQFNGDRINAFETKAALNIAIESMVSKRISVGADLGYSSMDIINADDRFYYLYPYPVNFNTFTDGDEITYRRLSLGVKSKVFLKTSGKFLPYLGLGVHYNRITLRYRDNNTTFNGALGNKNEGVRGGNVSATGLLGAELNFNETIGVNLEFSYARALTQGFGQDRVVGNNLGYNYDEVILQKTGGLLDDSDIGSVTLGMIVRF